MNLLHGIALFTLISLMTSVDGQTMLIRNQTFALKWQCNIPVLESPYGVIGGISLVMCAARCLGNGTQCVSFIWDKSVPANVACGLHKISPASPCPTANVSETFSLYEKVDANTILGISTTTTAETTTQSVPTTTLTTTQSVPTTTLTTTQSVPTTTVNSCQNSGTWTGAVCLCPIGCRGTFCENCYTDCSEGWSDGLTGTAVVSYIQPLSSPTAFQVLCNFDNRVTYVQYRRYGNVSFNRDWQSYVDGFGDLEGDFWLGNKYIHLITDQKSYTCGVRLYDDTDIWQFDSYSDFKVDSESNLFRITYTPYSFDWGMSPSDSTKDSRNQPFSTHDRDSTGCATIEQAGWWYNTGCTNGANVNGVLPFDWSSITGVTMTGLGLY
ncbi:angiopoietin-related protein 2-like [Pecten maximus]|uniref:angiopoietin-related protein 2-like n=1 Tax=Pecten maximus TaxID=6579 RepID=UPI001457FEDB|nr:angiopoietin-related protein 2-like [Pecten maximus]